MHMYVYIHIIIEDACGDHTAAPLSLHFGINPCGKQASKASQARTSHQIKARKSEQAKQASKKAGRKEGKKAEGTMNQPKEYLFPALFSEGWSTEISPNYSVPLLKVEKNTCCYRLVGSGREIRLSPQRERSFWEASCDSMQSVQGRQ